MAKGPTKKQGIGRTNGGGKIALTAKMAVIRSMRQSKKLRNVTAAEIGAANRKRG